MTRPKWSGGRQFGGGGRHYSFPDLNEELPSVTNVIGQLDKPALRNWAAKEVATYAVQYRSQWDGLPEKDAIDLLKRSPYRNSGSAADRGSAVHEAIEHDIDPDDLPAELAGYVRAARSFISDVLDVGKPHWDEVTLRHVGHGYAGTTDRIGWTLEGELAVIDWKSSKSIGYIEHALQLIALSRCNEAVFDDGEVRPVRMQPTVGMTVRLAADGAWEARRLDLWSSDSAALWEGFLGLVAMKRADSVWGRFGTWEG